MIGALGNVCYVRLNFFNMELIDISEENDNCS